MLKIRLFCAAGMSTSMLMAEMRDAATRMNLEIDVEAYPIKSLKDHAQEADVCLLGPQVSYELNNASKICELYHKPVAVIPMQDYGMMNGKAVVELAEKLMKERK